MDLNELLCRVCLKQDELMVDVYEHVEEQQTDLCTLLERCGDIKVDRSDAFPKYLCQECTKELLISAKFRSKCVAAEELLRQRITACADEDTAAALAPSEVAGEESVLEEEDIIEYDPSEHVELYEECETAQEEEEESEQVQVQVLAHQTQQVLGEQPRAAAVYNCDDCGAVFQQAGTLQQHIAKAHTLAETYECQDCGHSFTQHCNLLKHSCASSHALTPEARSRSALHRCIHCGKCLQTASGLVIHMRVHNGHRPFACDACPKAFKTNGALVTHQKRHLRLMEFKCEFCGKDFVESSNLRRHIAALHTNERPHTCTVCQRSFSRVYLLELHKRTHTGERPYACSHCSSRFAQLSVLRSHERIHTGERRHRCAVCQKSFSRLIQLKNHARKSCCPTDAQTADS
ncbi:hypothetical protein KR222_007748 [Zaprionus bogoriensis]|nr:hypothetical protein KR222_007748 [Zaprionus bogoriensis]